MTPLGIFFFGLIGLAVGSFLNLAIDRLPVGQSLVRPRSQCPHCKHPVSSLDLVPVLNYIWLLGRCRYCKARIPWRLPLIELATGALFAYIGYRYGLEPQVATSILYVSLMVVIFFVDLEHSLIPNRIVYPFLIIVFGLAPVGLGDKVDGIGWAYLDAFIGGVIGFFVFLVIYITSRGGMGPGDVKLAALIGLMLGLRSTLVALPIAFIAGGIVAIALILLKRRGRKGAIPFGPFLSAAAMLSLFAGPEIHEWYLGLFNLT